jgi:hypothetical protein
MSPAGDGKRDEAECPTCRKPNDRGVKTCWSCGRLDPYPAPSDPMTCGDDWSSALMRNLSGAVLPGIYPPTGHPTPTQSSGLGGISFAPTQYPQPLSLQIDRSEMTLLAEGLLGNAERLVNFDPAEALRLIDRAREIVEKLR